MPMPPTRSEIPVIDPMSSFATSIPRSQFGQHVAATSRQSARRHPSRVAQAVAAATAVDIPSIVAALPTIVGGCRCDAVARPRAKAPNGTRTRELLFPGAAGAPTTPIDFERRLTECDGLADTGVRRPGPAKSPRDRARGSPPVRAVRLGECQGASRPRVRGRRGSETIRWMASTKAPRGAATRQAGDEGAAGRAQGERHHRGRASRGRPSDEGVESDRIVSGPGKPSAVDRRSVSADDREELQVGSGRDLLARILLDAITQCESPRRARRCR